jgi:dihydrofolate reductase
MAVRAAAFSVSLDGFGAGPEQSLEQPMGRGGLDLHRWALGTRTFRAMFGQGGGSTGTDDGFAVRSFANLGAWILGRNMFGPVRGPWPDHAWRGWWGDEPPYHCDVFVLTHHPRPALEMKGGTVFHFVAGEPAEILRKASAAAKGRDVRIGGGVATLRQFIAAGLVDEMHLAMSPVLLGEGEPLFAGLDLPALGWRVTETAATELAQHVVLRR